MCFFKVMAVLLYHVGELLFLLDSHKLACCCFFFFVSKHRLRKQNGHCFCHYECLTGIAATFPPLQLPVPPLDCERGSLAMA